MPDTLTLVAILVPCLIIAVVLHEIGHGYVAKLLGDDTASRRGRLTLNPISHIDPIGTLLVPAVLALFGGPVFGWAKPVPVRKSQLRNPRFGMMAVAIAGPATNFVLAAIGAVMLGLSSLASGVPYAQDESLVTLALTFFVLVNVIIGLFNMLPIPPFDGSHIVAGFLPQQLLVHWSKLQKLGLLLIIAIIAASWFYGTEWIEAWVLPPVQAVTLGFLSLADMVVGTQS